MLKKCQDSNERDTIVSLYTLEEQTLQEIANRYPFSVSVVRRILREAGVAIRPPKRRTRTPPPKTSPAWQYEHKIIHCYTAQKMSLRATAKRFDTSSQSVRSILEARSIPTRTLKESRQTRPDKYGYGELIDATKVVSTYYHILQRNAQGQPTHTLCQHYNAYGALIAERYISH